MLVYPKFEVTNDTFIFDDAFIETVKKDFKICWISREMSLLGRKDVLTGKAKFGIFGDGKEVAQVAMAHTFQRGDWRSGYYRDQTFMLAVGLLSVESFFSQMYADSENDPFSGGRQMNAHFASPTIDKDGKWHFGGKPIKPVDLAHKIDVAWNLVGPEVSVILGSLAIPSIGQKFFVFQNSQKMLRE
jgi:hypothetical protein